MAVVPENEIVVDFVRSSGPGGQKVNKTSSKARLRWSVGGSLAFSDAEKVLIRRAAGKRLNADDEIVIAADALRSQYQNRAAVVERLQHLVAQALVPRKKRVAVKVSRAQKQRRLDQKKIVARKKQSRKSPEGEW